MLSALVMLWAGLASAQNFRIPAVAAPVSPIAATLAAAGARYGIERSPLAVPNLGEGDYGQVRGGVMPLSAERFLGARLPAPPGAAVAVKIAYDDPGGMLAHEAAMSRRLEDAGGGKVFVRSAYDPQLGVLVMEDLSRYKPLDEWAESARSLDARVVARVEAQLQEALAVLDEAGLVHSDLRPANVLVAPGGRVKIVDLGLAAERGSYAPHLLAARHRGGNQDYVSANQRRDGPAVTGDDRRAVAVIMRRLRRGDYSQ
jgi:serine/threonine protein kinase